MRTFSLLEIAAAVSLAAGGALSATSAEALTFLGIGGPVGYGYVPADPPVYHGGYGGGWYGRPVHGWRRW